MIPLAAFALTGCLALSPAADHIRAVDLAAVLPVWATLDPETQLLPAPIPGVQRLLSVAELRRLAVRWNVTEAAARDLCFTIPVSAPDPGRMLAAMQRQLPDARIEIIESSRQPAPEGEIEFPVTGLHTNLWNGSVSYAHGRKFSVWARVKIAVTVSRVVAAQDLKPGQPLDAAQLRVETQDAMPSNASFIKSVADAAGRIARRSIPAGTPIRPEWLEAPKEIQRGETVHVEVIQGATHLHLEGVAQAAGAIGDTIPIENPVSKRRFPAQVESKGKVVVKGSL